MSFEEEFDSIMRQKGDELDYPFDEKNWEKAAAMLEAERVVAPRKFLTAPVLITAGLLISGAVFFIINSGSPSVAAKKLVSENKTPASSVTTERNTELSPALTTPVEVAALPVREQSAKEVISSPSPLATVAKAQPASHTEQPASVAASQAARPENKIATTSSSDNTSVKNTSAAPQAELTDARSGATEIPSVPVEPTGKPVAAINDASNADQSTTNRVTNTSGETNSIANPESGAGTQATEQQKTAENNATLYLLQRLPIPTAASEAAEQEVAGTYNYMNRYDDDYFKSNKRTKVHFFNVELGGTYLLGWNTNAGKDGKGLDWFGGVNYGVYLTRKMSVSLGIQAYDIKNITQAFYSGKKVEYDFGAITSNTVITSNTLYYAAVPIKVNYAINRNNQVSLGANIGYMVDCSNKYETYQVEDGAVIHYKPVKNTGVYQAANSWNILLGVSYRTEVLPRLYLNTELVYGLSDIFKNTKTNSNKEQAMGLRLSLQYSLFDK